MVIQKTLRLWELAGAEPKRVFSPYVWRVRLVLAHKGIEYESKTWRYNDKQLIAPAQKVGVNTFRRTVTGTAICID